MNGNRGHVASHPIDGRIPCNTPDLCASRAPSSQVSIGIHHHSRRRVAIKVVEKSRLTDPNEAKRMQREIRVMRHLTHPCVIKLFEVRVMRHLTHPCVIKLFEV